MVSLIYSGNTSLTNNFLSGSSIALPDSTDRRVELYPYPRNHCNAIPGRPVHPSWHFAGIFCHHAVPHGGTSPQQPCRLPEERVDCKRHPDTGLFPGWSLSFSLPVTRGSAVVMMSCPCRRSRVAQMMLLPISGTAEATIMTLRFDNIRLFTGIIIFWTCAGPVSSTTLFLYYEH